MRAAALVLLATIVVGCSDDVTVPADPGPKPAVWVSDGEPSAPSFTLRESALTKTSLALEVVGHGIGNLYGASFRLEVDPNALTLTSFEAAGVFGANDIVQGREPRPGLGFYVITQRGQVPGKSVDDEVVAVVRYTRAPDAVSPVRFVVERSDKVDDEGAIDPNVTWIGGELRVE